MTDAKTSHCHNKQIFIEWLIILVPYCKNKTCINMALLFIAQNVACTSHTVDLTNWWCRGVTTSTCTRCWSTTERPFQNKLSAWFASTLSIRGTQGATICISATKRTRTRSDGSWNSSKCLQNAQFIIISWTDSIKKYLRRGKLLTKTRTKFKVIEEM